MKGIAAFDIGTTAVKAVLVAESGEPLRSLSRDIPTLTSGDFREQDPRVWWEAFLDLLADLRKSCPEAEISGIVMSGQMQDVIPVDEKLEPVCPAILYSDGRAVEEAEALAAAAGADRILRVTGNHMDGTLSLPKIMWLRKHRPELYARARCFLISSKDYVIARLTGVCAGDYTACSTAGAMDLETRDWDREILSAAGVDPALMPRVYPSHAFIGAVTKEAARAAGCSAGTPVYAGVGDAGATTLASGIMREGQYNVNLGTSGWVATVSSRARFNEGGIFNLAAMPAGKVINVVPFLNAGSVHRWVSRLFSADGSPDYARTQALLDRSVPGSHGVFALPYLVGERFPVLDPDVRGMFVGLTPETAPEDLARAMLEGVAFSIRQGMEMLEVPPVSVSVIGGGGRVETWCQVLADVLGQSVTVFPDSDTLPARAIAAAALIGAGKLPDYDAFLRSLQQETQVRVYHPDSAVSAAYASLYRKYLGLYKASRAWYHA